MWATLPEHEKIIGPGQAKKEKKRKEEETEEGGSEGRREGDGMAGDI